MWETLVQSLGWEDPWRRKWLTTPVFLPGKSHGHKSLVSYSPWGCKELDTTTQIPLELWSFILFIVFLKFIMPCGVGFTQWSGSPVAQRVKRLPALRETQVWSLGQEDPLEKEMAPTPVLLPEKFHGQRSLVGYSPWVAKSWTRLSDFTLTHTTYTVDHILISKCFIWI